MHATAALPSEAAAKEGHRHKPRRAARFLEIDAHVGRRLRERRVSLGISQERLGAAVGLTFQQIQKYEKGDNRVGASMLWHLAEALDATPSFFFDGLTAEGAPLAEEAPPELRRRDLELARNFRAIDDPKVRLALFNAIKACAKADGEAA